MRNLPTLPGCGAPATVRIEVYDGPGYGSLDATAYSCSTHAGAIEQMIRDAGLTPFRTSGAGLVDNPAVCGYLVRYNAPVEPAGPADHNGGTDSASVAAYAARLKVPVPAAGEHPRWCRRGERLGTTHLSPPLQVNPTGPEPRWRIFVEEQHGTGEPVWLVLQVDFSGRLTDYTLPLDVARSLARQIRTGLGMAETGR